MPTPKSFDKMNRRDQVADIAARCSDFMGDVESLKDALESWYDNMPEGIQSGSKGSAVETVKDALQTLYDALSEASGLEAEW